MIDPYAVLGVALDADDAAIRARYLELVREFPPEQQAERFAAIRAAYEAIKSLDNRAERLVNPNPKDFSLDDLITEAACRTPRQRIMMDALLAQAYPDAVR